MLHPRPNVCCLEQVNNSIRAKDHQVTQWVKRRWIQTQNIVLDEVLNLFANPFNQVTIFYFFHQFPLSFIDFFASIFFFDFYRIPILSFSSLSFTGLNFVWLYFGMPLYQIITLQGHVKIYGEDAPEARGYRLLFWPLFFLYNRLIWISYPST